MAATEPRRADLTFAADLFKAADKLRQNVEPSEYKHIVLGLIFLKYVSEAFAARHTALQTEPDADPEDPDEYLAENVFWVPQTARWSHLQANATSPNIGRLIDDALVAIEEYPSNGKLKGALPRGYSRPALNATMLGGLINQFSDIGMHDEFDTARDLFGRVYEYCLSMFAANEGKRGGEFLTPRSVVGTLVEMLEPYKGRVYDPCCGTGGMFVQSEKFIAEHGGRLNDIAVYGQEINHTTYRLAKMNLAVQGLDAEVAWNNEGTLHRDAFPDLKFDFVLANPPFNISDWGGERVRDDARWAFGTPPVGNANFAWLQHIIHHLAPRGTAGVVLANGSMSSQQSGEGEIRRAMIQRDVVDCMVALPGQLFYSTQIPACLWILARNKSANGHRDRRGEVLFIDARKLGFMADRVRREFSADDVATIAGAYHRWRGKPEALEKAGLEPYADEAGFCKSAKIDGDGGIASHGYVLTPGRYVGAADVEDDGVPFAETASRTPAADPVAILGGLILDPARAAKLAALFPDTLGDNGLPEGWVVREIGALTEIVGGTTPSTRSPEFWDNGIHRWATPKDLSNNSGINLFDTERRITDVGLAAIGSGLSPPGSVLLSSRAPIGYLAIADQPVAVNQGFIVLRPSDQLTKEFAYIWCQQNMDIIKANANGSTFQEISKGNFRPLAVNHPGTKLMGGFTELVGPLFSMITVRERESQTLASTRDLLLPKLMSGEIRLRDAEAVVEAVP